MCIDLLFVPHLTGYRQLPWPRNGLPKTSSFPSRVHCDTRWRNGTSRRSRFSFCLSSLSLYIDSLIRLDYKNRKRRRSRGFSMLDGWPTSSKSNFERTPSGNSVWNSSRYRQTAKGGYLMLLKYRFLPYHQAATPQQSRLLTASNGMELSLVLSSYSTRAKVCTVAVFCPP